MNLPKLCVNIYFTCKCLRKCDGKVSLSFSESLLSCAAFLRIITELYKIFERTNLLSEQLHKICMTIDWTIQDVLLVFTRSHDDLAALQLFVTRKDY